MTAAARTASSFLAGLLFAVGLAISGMTDPTKVIGFLDVAGAWDPTLGLVMAGAVAVYATVYWVSRRKMERPICAPSFVELEGRSIEPRLLVGSALFGAGWGLAGYCPGPALVSAAAGGAQALAFTLAMLIGLWITAAVLRSR